MHALALYCCYYQRLWKNTPPEKKTFRTLSFENTTSGAGEAGEQFLLPDCRIRVRVKGLFFHRHRYHYCPTYHRVELQETIQGPVLLLPGITTTRRSNYKKQSRVHVVQSHNQCQYQQLPGSACGFAQFSRRKLGVIGATQVGFLTTGHTSWQDDVSTYRA